MNTYLYTYKGDPIKVLAQSDESDLAKIGNVYVRIYKVCPVRIKPFLKLVGQNGKLINEH